VALSPITKIFGGQFRSVIYAAHQKPSVTLDPYQHVQLDISEPQIYTIEDALANISQTEVISHYKSDKGDMVEATKQTFFEKLPKVLILHLKRFHFAVEEGSGFPCIQKISKTIGYKRDLQIPPECISPQQQGVTANYKLFGVVYHHGKSTEGGHYTVDLHYKHSDTWINLDDVSIKEIQPEDVETVYEDESAMRRRIVMGGSGEDERTAYLLFYERQ
jgi:ubiquitin carboxyl-terminal hydrolase 10